MHIAVFGANGAIGAGFVRQFRKRRPDCVIQAVARVPLEADGPLTRPHRVDPADEAALERLAERIAADGPLDMAVIAIGMLHGEGHRPEKALRDVSAEALHALFQVNTVLPALILKHIAPLLHRKQRAVIAALSARVGSIGDNRLGGWYAYRASKAALNMIVCNAAIEIGRRNPQAVIAALHPGTVASDLSAPFQSGVAEGKLFAPDFSAAALIDVLDGLTAQDSGRCFAWDGTPVPP